MLQARASENLFEGARYLRSNTRKLTVGAHVGYSRTVGVMEKRRQCRLRNGPLHCVSKVTERAEHLLLQTQREFLASKNEVATGSFSKARTSGSPSWAARKTGELTPSPWGVVNIVSLCWRTYVGFWWKTEQCLKHAEKLISLRCANCVTQTSDSGCEDSVTLSHSTFCGRAGGFQCQVSSAPL